MLRQSTPFTEEKHYVKEHLTPFLGENAVCAKDITKLEEWPTFSGEEEYTHIEFIRKIIMFQDFHLPSEIIVGTLHSLFTRTEKKWYYKMRQDHGKHDWLWCKSEIIPKWANNSWRFKIENSFQVPFLTQKIINHLLGSSNRKTDCLIYAYICLTQ
ncbi:hypothetical protein O181_033901 [Austropuccinia psidii MF-1]|uniref:Uncharacterized protein n=1 Tax=Austropuccinia psidii MF-1 TaxID=1389203 RepID=A0A9Q3H7I0_9BASI|nr:hypothetical protein [Austropuccinia psidii MF-1]